MFLNSDLLDNYKIKLDYLVIRLNKNKINSKFWGIVENSPSFETSFNWIDLKIEFDLFQWWFTSYNIVDLQNNKLAQIIITNDKNKRYDIYDKITIYWTYFNLYYEFFTNIFNFFWITNNSFVTRFDLCFDLPVNHIYYNFKEELIEKVKTYWSTWKCYKNDKRYEVRIYDKLLDINDKKLYKIVDNFWNRPYFDLLNSFEYTTRFELQVNSKLIKEKKYLLWDVLKKDIHYKMLNNYFSICFDNFWFKIREFKNKENLLVKQKFDDSYERNRKMSIAYLKNMYFQKPDEFEKEIHNFLYSFNKFVNEKNIDFKFAYSQLKKIHNETKWELYYLKSELKKYREKYWQI